MANKNKIILFFAYISLVNSIIEIPLKSIQVRGVTKYGKFKIPEPADDFSDENNLDNPSYIEQGNSIINTNELFIATVRIGSRQQPFNLLLDTGSSIAWVPKTGSADRYQKQNHYDPSSSTTSLKTSYQFSIQYGSGSCSGFYFYDNFNYINNRNFKFLFGVAFKTDFNVQGADGIIGLSHFYPNEELSFIHMLFKEGVTQSTIFSLKFGNDIKVGKLGKLIIGKHSDFSQSTTVTSPLVRGSGNNQFFWICNIKSLGIKNSYGLAISSRSFNIIFDTGTNAILLPLQYYYDLSSNINRLNCFFVANEQHNLFQIVCQNINELPDFRFEINGNILIVPKIYTFYRTKDGLFYSKVLFVENEVYIIGSPFFFAFHTLFDRENEKLHFYPENPAYVEKYIR
jgi:hypothetical protein